MEGFSVIVVTVIFLVLVMFVLIGSGGNLSMFTMVFAPYLDLPMYFTLPRTMQFCSTVISLHQGQDCSNRKNRSFWKMCFLANSGQLSETQINGTNEWC